MMITMTIIPDQARDSVTEGKDWSVHRCRCVPVSGYISRFINHWQNVL